MKIEREKYKLNKDVLYKCPAGACGYEITSYDEAGENEDENGLVYCPVCHRWMFEVVDWKIF